jgi:hypothetical protein
MNTAKLQIKLLIANQQNTLYKTKISSTVFVLSKRANPCYFQNRVYNNYNQIS